MQVSQITYFRSRNDWRKWLRKNYNKKDHLWLGFYKVHTKEPGLAYTEAVEEALCFGWIDGILKRIDEEKHIIRFSPRRPDSIWSPHNIKRVKKLIKQGKMRKVGKDKVPIKFLSHLSGATK